MLQGNIGGKVRNRTLMFDHPDSFQGCLRPFADSSIGLVKEYWNPDPSAPNRALCLWAITRYWWNIRESDSFTISLQGKPATHSYTPWWKQYESNIRRFLRTALQAAATNQQLPYFQLTLIIEGLFRASRRNLLRWLWELSKKAYSACPLWRLNGARVLAYELYW